MYWIPCVIYGKDPTIPWQQSREIQILERAAVYNHGDNWGCCFRSIEMCLQYGRCLRPCGVSKSWDVLCCTCIAGQDVQKLVGDVPPRVCVENVKVELRLVWRRWQSTILRAVQWSGFKRAISAVFLNGCCSIEEIVHLRADNVDKSLWIVCQFVHVRFSFLDVCNLMVAILWRCVSNVCNNNLVDGKEWELVFEWALIFTYCGGSREIVCLSGLFLSTIDDVKINFQ